MAEGASKWTDTDAPRAEIIQRYTGCHVQCNIIKNLLYFSCLNKTKYNCPIELIMKNPQNLQGVQKTGRFRDLRISYMEILA